MSELKAYIAPTAYGTGLADYYIKSEADKVIAEKDAEIARLNAIRKVHVEAIESMEAGLLQDDKEIRHHKYKRSLAMADACENEEKRLDAIAPLFETDNECWEYNSDYWNKWYKRWLAIASKFKEAK